MAGPYLDFLATFDMADLSFEKLFSGLPLLEDPGFPPTCLPSPAPATSLSPFSADPLNVFPQGFVLGPLSFYLHIFSQ